MLTSCCICGLALELDWLDDDSALCLDCLVANFSGQTLPEVWGGRLAAIPPVPPRQMREAFPRVAAPQRGEDARDHA